jgi:serine/threonine protein kinase/tetratricopeptide (TPR) repeat protein
MSSAPGNPASGAAALAAARTPDIPDYELGRIVGRGSYGDVWLARSVTGAWRAIKVVWRERFANAEPFEREFRGLKEFADVSLGVSSQMALLHVGRNDAAGSFFYVMELADDVERGREIDPATYVPLTLAELRARRGRIPADDCVRFGVELARGLASLHRRGLVHRDVKPSNVILVSGVPKLADIGLVAPSASARTFVGTEGYVPPEGPGAPSADVFALAKMLYELSTGHDRQEFPKLPAELATLADRAALLELNEIFLRACGPTPAERYRNGAAILADLSALHAGVSLRTRRFTRVVLRVAAVIAMVGTLGLGAWEWRSRRDPQSPPVPVGVYASSVDVLPLNNATGEPSLELFADGLSDEILQALQGERDLRVTGSWSSFWAKGKTLPPVELAHWLRVAQLVEGSLHRTSSGYRIEVRLTRGADGVSEPVGTFERRADDVVELREDVRRAVARRILNRTTARANAPPTSSVAAYNEFLRGRALQLRGVDSAAEAAEAFQRAIELDPNFAVAWARRADALRTDATKAIHGAWDCGPALAVAHRAVDLQPDLALAWSVRGMIRGIGMGETNAGLADLAHAEKLGGPNAETHMARFLVGFFASETGGLLPLARDAVASNPVNHERLSVLTLAFAYLGEYAEADRLLQEPKNFSDRVRLRRAWRGADAAVRFAGRWAPSKGDGMAMQVRMLAEIGRTDEARKLVADMNEPIPWDVYAAAGMMDQARSLAEKAVRGLYSGFAAFPSKSQNETEMTRRDIVRSQLIAAEIVLGHHEAALGLLDGWRAELPDRKPNRRAGGPVAMTLPGGYARLGKPDVAIELLHEFDAVGRAMGYDLRDSAVFASLRGNPRFEALRAQAEARAALQPDPTDDTATGK